MRAVFIPHATPGHHPSVNIGVIIVIIVNNWILLSNPLTINVRSYTVWTVYAYVSFQMFKGTVIVISSDPPCKDDYAEFTMVPWYLYLIKIVENIVIFLIWNLKVPICFMQMKCASTFVEKPQLTIISILNYKH